MQYEKFVFVTVSDFEKNENFYTYFGASETNLPKIFIAQVKNNEITKY